MTIEKYEYSENEVIVQSKANIFTGHPCVIQKCYWNRGNRCVLNSHPVRPNSEKCQEI